MGDDGENMRERVWVEGEGEASSKTEERGSGKAEARGGCKVKATMPPKKKKKSGDVDSSSFRQSIFGGPSTTAPIVCM